MTGDRCLTNEEAGLLIDVEGWLVMAEVGELVMNVEGGLMMSGAVLCRSSQSRCLVAGQVFALVARTG